MHQPAAPSQVATFTRAYPGTTDQARAVRTVLHLDPVGLARTPGGRVEGDGMIRRGRRARLRNQRASTGRRAGPKLTTALTTTTTTTGTRERLATTAHAGTFRLVRVNVRPEKRKFNLSAPFAGQPQSAICRSRGARGVMMGACY
jgi:hypothetical protein